MQTLNVEGNKSMTLACFVRVHALLGPKLIEECFEISTKEIKPSCHARSLSCDKVWDIFSSEGCNIHLVFGMCVPNVMVR